MYNWVQMLRNAREETVIKIRMWNNAQQNSKDMKLNTESFSSTLQLAHCWTIAIFVVNDHDLTVDSIQRVEQSDVSGQETKRMYSVQDGQSICPLEFPKNQDNVMQKWIKLRHWNQLNGTALIKQHHTVNRWKHSRFTVTGTCFMRLHAVNDTNTKSHTQQRLSYLKHAHIHTNILIYTKGLRNFVYINM